MTHTLRNVVATLGSERNVFSFIMVLIGATVLSSCGLSEPTRVSGMLTATETGSEVDLELTLFGPGDVPGCNTSPDLEFDQTNDPGHVAIVIRGHQRISDDPGACTELIDITGQVELPPIQVGETLQLEVSLRDQSSIFEIERAANSISIADIAEGNVSLDCSVNWSVSVPCIR